MEVVKQVEKELRELAELGIITKAKLSKCLNYLEAMPDEVAAYRKNGMRISAIADLVRDLAI